MFHYDGGLKLTAIDLAVDVRRRQPRGFISHAHSDHMGRHELALCTPTTARLYRHRLGDRRVCEMPFGETLEWSSFRLTTIPAGHVFGSAMLLADDGCQRLLYTGDFKLRPSSTAEPAQLPRADVLVMESTFGHPRYRLPPRETVIEQLVSLCAAAIQDGVTPIVHAYTLGKAQEVTRILTDHGFPVRQHPLALAISRIYEAAGCQLGPLEPYEGTAEPGTVLVLPPRNQRCEALPMPARRTHIAVTGWALDRGARYRYRVDHILPLSDHADYDELIECIERVEPAVIFCTHGPASFVDDLRQRGLNASPLAGAAAGAATAPAAQQRTLFR